MALAASSAVLAFCLFIAVVVGSTPCTEQWECISVTDDYNYVSCSNGQCSCKADLGFSGSATAEDRCGCDGSVYWGNGVPYCKKCDPPSEIIYKDGLPYCVDLQQCDAFSGQVGNLYEQFFTLDALIRVRCSTNPEEEIFVGWTGSAYSFADGERQRNVFNFVGMNVARCFPQFNGGYILASREVMLYTDPVTGQKLTNWTNPWTEEIVNVVHVANDPVVQNLPPGPFYKAVITNHMASFVLDIFLFYPNFLGSDPTFEEYSPQTMYMAGEFFKMSAPLAEVINTGMSHTTTLHLSWFRESPWLPWMKNGDRPGHLLFSGFGGRVTNFDGLPPLVRDEILAKVPIYTHAPSSVPTVPNQSSWTYFATHFDDYLQFKEFPLP